MSDYYETWKGIAYTLSRSERWCRYMACRQEDPLPVFKVGGIVRITEADLDDWLSRQRSKSIRSQVASPGLPPNLQLIA